MKSRPLKLLLLEEDEHSFQIMSEIFSRGKKAATGVYRARNVAEALRELRKGTYDACILDCGKSSPAILHDFIARNCLPPVTVVTRPASPEDLDADEVAIAGRGQFQERVLEQVVKTILGQGAELGKSERDEIRFWAKFMAEPAGLALVDEKGHLIFSNETFQRMLGYEGQESAELTYRNIIHPQDAIENEWMFRKLLSGEHAYYQRENRFLLRDGSSLRARQTAIGLTDPEMDGRKFVLISLESLTQPEQTPEKDMAALTHGESLHSRLLNARKSERQLIAQELHDGLGACLSAIKYTLEKNLHQIQKTKGRADISLGEVVPLVQSAIDETRRISSNLWPSTLDNPGIGRVIHSFCAEFEKTYSSIKVEKIVDVPEEDVPPALRIIIYRILQEALQNVVKHSGGDFVKVSLLRKTGEIELLVNDNGRGFDQEQTMSGDSSAGMGLNSMKKRVEISGGIFSITSQPGGGTTIRGSWPTD